MPLANCPKCGGLFNKITQEICPKCFQEEEELLRQAQEYLRQNRNAAVFQIVQELDIDQMLIEKWVKEKRLNIVTAEDLQDKKFCLECGREIKGAGTLCKTCQLKKVLKKGPSAASPTASSDAGSPAKKAVRGMVFKKE